MQRQGDSRLAGRICYQGESSVLAESFEVRCASIRCVVEITQRDRRLGEGWGQPDIDVLKKPSDISTDALQVLDSEQIIGAGLL